VAKQLNLKAYRFSVSWPRIYPIGHGKINPAGLDYYDRLVESLLAQAIDPYITLITGTCLNLCKTKAAGLIAIRQAISPIMQLPCRGDLAIE